MRALIVEILKELAVTAYTILEERTESAELFFIKKELDARRMKDVTIWSVRVFRDFEEDGKRFRGMSEIQVAPGTTKDELRKELAKAYEAAKNVRNEWFELYKGQTEPMKVRENGLTKLSLPEIAGAFAKAIFAADTRSDAFLNSVEIFAEKHEVRFLSSEGFENGYRTACCKGEFVTQCKEPQDVEQFFEFEYEDLTPEALTEKAKAALNTVSDRAKASAAPKTGTYDVVLSDDQLKKLLSFYGFRSMANFVYAGYFDSAVGKSLQGEEVKGEKLNFYAVPKRPYSEEGIPMVERQLLAEGKLCFLQGPTRFARYLGIEPTGAYRACRLENGTVPFEEMKKGCLYPVSFSDFQMDPISGRFGGEIRLAYYYGENGVELLTGGSINGNLVEKQADLEFSLERYTDSDYTGPFAVKVKGVAVAGI